MTAALLRVDYWTSSGTWINNNRLLLVEVDDVWAEELQRLIGRWIVPVDKWKAKTFLSKKLDRVTFSLACFFSLFSLYYFHLSTYIIILLLSRIQAHSVSGWENNYFHRWCGYCWLGLRNELTFIIVCCTCKSIRQCLLFCLLPTLLLSVASTITGITTAIRILDFANAALTCKNPQKCWIPTITAFFLQMIKLICQRIHKAGTKTFTSTSISTKKISSKFDACNI